MTTFINAYSTVVQEIPWTGPGATYFKYRSTVTGTNQEISDFQDHLNGFLGYAIDFWITQGIEYNAFIHSISQHIRETRSQYVFERDASFEPEDLKDFKEWARATNSIFFLNDGGIYNADGVNLLDPNTKKFAPIHPLSKSRSERIRTDLGKKGMSVPQSLPPVRSEMEVQLRSTQEAASRFRALVIVAHLAAAVLDGDKNTAKNIYTVMSNSPYDFTPTELAFIDTVAKESQKKFGKYGKSTQEAAVQLVWRWESATVLGWVLGKVSMDPMVLEPANVDRLTTLEENPDELYDIHRLIDTFHICDGYESTYSQRWYAVDQDVNPENSPPVFENVHCSILLERHHAFSWLHHPLSTWDDVDLNT